MTNIIPVILISNEEYWLPFVLEQIKGLFPRVVIYDIGSTDRTREIIDSWIKANPRCEVVLKLFPMLDPKIQGTFRNSMIAETKAEYYFILDGDELYSPSSLEKIIKSPETFVLYPEKTYGAIKRIEVAETLTEAFGVTQFVPHHRLYHRTMLFFGSHPGEYPEIKQTDKNTLIFEDIICYHFHNCARSSKDMEVPKRIERRARATYRPGSLALINILEKLPILKNQLGTFSRNPELERIIKS